MQESYILARYFPSAGHGSRRVLADAILTDPRRLGIKKQDLIKQLDAELAKHRDKEMEIVEFRDATGKFLGPAEYDEAVWDRYRKFAQKSFWGRDGRRCSVRVRMAFKCLCSDGRSGCRSIGRHRGHEEEKLVLDILSYECRAALHRCYSAVWCDLLPHLANKYSMTDESVTFHRFWHLDQCQNRTHLKRISISFMVTCSPCTQALGCSYKPRPVRS